MYIPAARRENPYREILLGKAMDWYYAERIIRVKTRCFYIIERGRYHEIGGNKVWNKKKILTSGNITDPFKRILGMFGHIESSDDLPLNSRVEPGRSQ